MPNPDPNRSSSVTTWLKKYGHVLLVAVILLVSLYVRLHYIAGVDVKPISDSLDYDQRAMRLLQQGTFQTGQVHGATYRPPGYIVFLAGLYKLYAHKYRFVYAVQSVLSVAMLYAIYLIGKRLLQQRTVALVGLLLSALYLPFIGYSGALLTEVLFLTLLLYAVYAFLRGAEEKKWSWMVLSGILFGLAALTRSVALVVPFVLIVWWMIDQRRVKFNKRTWSQLILLVAVMFLTISPWTIRNYMEQKQLVVVNTITGLNLLIGNNQYAKGFYTEKVFDVPGYQQAFKEGKTDAQRDKIMEQAAIHWILNNKQQFLTLTRERFGMYLAVQKDWVADYYQWGRIGFNPNFVLNYQNWLMALGVLGGFLALFTNRKALLLFLLAGYFIASMSVFYVQARYRFPAMPFVILLNAYLLWRIKRKPILLIPVAVLGALIVMGLQQIAAFYQI